MVFQCINIRQVPWEVLKTAGFGLGFQHLPRDLISQVPAEVLKTAAFGLSFQHLPWDLANVFAWITMFDPYTGTIDFSLISRLLMTQWSICPCPWAAYVYK